MLNFERIESVIEEAFHNFNSIFLDYIEKPDKRKEKVFEEFVEKIEVLKTTSKEEYQKIVPAFDFSKFQGKETDRFYVSTEDLDMLKTFGRMTFFTIFNYVDNDHLKKELKRFNVKKTLSGCDKRFIKSYFSQQSEVLSKLPYLKEIYQAWLVYENEEGERIRALEEEFFTELENKAKSLAKNFEERIDEIK